MSLPFDTLKTAFANTPLFGDKTWQFSPEAFPLTAEQVEEIEAIGQASLAFHRALETLYLRSSATDRSLLRNSELKAPWVAQWLDRGKPDWLIAHSRQKSMRGRFPAVLRPDLLMTETGFALTELDSVPGGIGATGFLGDLYAEDAAIVGGNNGMTKGFADIMHALGAGRAPVVVAISNEADSYRPEFEWLVEGFTQREGPCVRVCAAEDLQTDSQGRLCENKEGHTAPIGGVYRFFELFDLPALPARETLVKAEAEGDTLMSPPMRAFQEEKLALGLFHHPRLQAFWHEQLPHALHERLKAIIPQTWIVEPVDKLPAQCCIWGPDVEGVALTDWMQLSNARQKQRDYILKISGFHESAWGSRSVTLGTDVPQDVWAQKLTAALSSSSSHPFILQRYAKPARKIHPIYTPDGQSTDFACRVRLCPYYFIKADTVQLGGVLATLCPADKKIIHGMSVAALLPCRLA